MIRLYHRKEKSQIKRKKKYTETSSLIRRVLLGLGGSPDV